MDEQATTGPSGRPTRIGVYRVLESLGEGGMGVVYLAEQTEPVRRRVAIKVLKPGLDTRQVVTRFHAERQALAIMDHPDIATVYDAGTTDDGRPYFVMEFVPGVPITDYCDRRRLPIDARLRLFERVCRAVHHAHQKGVIHRDLKPNNILVTDVDEETSPKVIDFGIAKTQGRRLTEETIDTVDRQVLGTPAYMSPEQASGQADVDTRTDVYSLGVLLYELLTGQSPYDTTRLRDASFGELERIICQEEPPRPSARLDAAGAAGGGQLALERRTTLPHLARRLRGDLDWVVMRAIEKDRTRRYAAVFALAADVRRVLDDEPVEAGPPSRIYRFRKFCVRHRPLVAATVAVATILVAATVVSVVFASSALRARDEAQRHQQQAERHQQQAERASTLAQQRLWESYRAQARAARSSSLPGRRSTALAALARAAEIRPDPGLRDEAIACLALFDLVEERALERTPLVSGTGLRVIDRLAFGSPTGEIIVRSITDDRTLATLPGPAARVRTMRFSSGGRYLAATYGDDAALRLVVWDVPQQTRVVEPANDYVRPGLAFPAGPGTPAWVAAVESDRRVHVYDLPGGGERDAFPVADDYVAIAGDPSGTRLAVATFAGRTLEIRDLEGATLAGSFPLPCGMYELSWRDDSAVIAAAGVDRMVHLVDPESGSVRDRLIGHQGQVVEAGWVPDRDILVSFSWDATVRIWNTATGQEILGPIESIGLHGIGDRIVIADEDGVRIWRLDFGEVYRASPGRDVDKHDRVEFHPDGRHLVACGPYGVRLWDLDAEREIAEIDPDPCQFVHVLPDGRGVIAMHRREVVRWDVAIASDGAVPTIARGPQLWEGRRCRGTGLSADGRLVVVCSTDAIEIIEVDTGRVVRTAPTYRGLATAASLSPDRRFLFTGTWQGEPARILNLEHGGVEQRFPGRHVVGAFAPDGRRVAVTDGRSARLLRVPGWQEVAAVPRGKTGDLASQIAFAPDGGLVAFQGALGTILLVDAGTGRLLASLRSPQRLGGTTTAFSPDGRLLACGTRSGVLEIWDLDGMRVQLRAMGLDWATSP